MRCAVLTFFPKENSSMRSLRSSLLVIACAFLAPAVVSAQQLGTLEAGVFAHYTSVNGDAQLGDHSTGFGGRGGIFLLRYLEAEIEYGRGTVKTGGVRYTDNAWFPTRIFATANVPITPRTRLLLGAGTVDTYKGDITRDEFEEGWSLLGGVRMCFGDAWSVRPEVVYDHTPSPSWMQRNFLFRPPGNPTSSRVQLRVGISRFIGRGSHSCAGGAESPRHPVPPPPPAAQPAPAPRPVAPTATLTASPASVVAGGSSTLAWRSTNAMSCSAPWASSSASTGSQSVSPASTTTYTVNCAGNGGTATASATVSVTEPAPPSTPPPAATPAPTTPHELFRLEGVYFDFDKASLKPEGRTKLDEAVAVLNRNADIRVEIQGHTDSIGTAEYNMGLSERRAKTVRDYLVSKGISATRMTTRGAGETEPVADNGTKAGRAQNRRVVLIEIH
jgi:outer membrane protein OmpA-like peptidoglycan-associated protein